MQELIASKREEIAELCRQHQVRRLAVFGSAAREDFDPARSDVDFLVEFEEMPIEEYADNKSSLRSGLAQLVGRSVDLLTWRSIVNPYLKYEIEATQEMLYAA